MSGIYVHIPFCKSRCKYCDFFSTTHLEKQTQYTEAVLSEWSDRRKELMGGIQTIYIGGGTPSTMSVELLRRIIDAIRQETQDSDLEVTIEANPGDITLENTLGNIISMCELAKVNNIIPVICSVLPADRFYWRPGVEPAQDIIRLNQMLKEYADSEAIQYIDYYSVLADENGALPQKYASDGVHPNPDCYEIMEEIVLKAL